MAIRWSSSSQAFLSTLFEGQIGLWRLASTDDEQRIDIYLFKSVLHEEPPYNSFEAMGKFTPLSAMCWNTDYDYGFDH